ncbi:MAG: multicopper oxidase domain-containing protein, partial [Actinomycetota bacterium]|nr:multicopper oxidase domain-containing protein [Actinomycetota bacterium]
MLTRRSFLLASATGASVALTGACASGSRVESPAATGRVEFPMRAAESEVDLGGLAVRTWTYTGTVPATEIRLRVGQTLRAPVANRLPQETTVHWHGLAIPNAMDGVPVLTGPAIAPGGDFTYEFQVPDAGTYYLH